MSSWSRGGAILAASAVGLVAPVAVAQEAVAIRHVPARCFAADAHPTLQACLTPPGAVSRVRVRFRSERGRPWYFVDMAPEGGCYVATLPRPLPSAGRVLYSIEAVSRASRESRTEEFAPRVERDAAACGGEAAPSVASASVVVRSDDASAPAVPAGFASPGHASLKPVLIGAAVLAAGGAAVAALAGGKGTDPMDADNDHDGFSVRAGDCDDGNAAVHPGGDVLFTVDFAFAGTTACAARNPQQQAYRVTNNSCAAVALQGLQVSLTLGGTCSGGQAYTVPLEATQVAAGSTAVVRRGAPAGAVAPLCCQSYPCAAGTCTAALQYALATSAGTKTVTQSYAISDPSGRDCPICGTIDTDETGREVAPMSDGHACLAGLHPY